VSSFFNTVSLSLTISPFTRSSSFPWKRLDLLIVDEIFTMTFAMFDFLRVLLIESCPRAVLLLVGDPGQLGAFVEENILHKRNELRFSAKPVTSKSCLLEAVLPENIHRLTTQFRCEEPQFIDFIKSVQEGEGQKCKAVLASILSRSSIVLPPSTTELQGCEIVMDWILRNPGAVVIVATKNSRASSGKDFIYPPRPTTRDAKKRFLHGVSTDITIRSLGADAINRFHVKSLAAKGKELITFTAVDSPQHVGMKHFDDLPLPKEVHLCKGVQVKAVMSIPVEGKDDIPAGTIGTVEDLNSSQVTVKFYPVHGVPVTVDVRCSSFTSDTFLDPNNFAVCTKITRENIPLIPCVAVCTRSSQGITCRKVLLMAHECWQPGEFATQISRVRALMDVELVVFTDVAVTLSHILKNIKKTDATMLMERFLLNE
jgi:hypothetical protein